MSQQQRPEKAATDIPAAAELPQRDGLDLPEPSYAPDSFDELMEQLPIGAPNLGSALDAPDPTTEECIQGFLPPPGEARPDKQPGRSKTAARIALSSGSQVDLDTEELLRTQAVLDEEGRRQEQPSRGENALRDWRLRQAIPKTSLTGARLTAALALLALLALPVVVYLGISDSSDPLVDAPTADLPVVDLAVPVAEQPRVTEPTPADEPFQARPKSGLPVPLVADSFKTWELEQHRYWQFDFQSEESLRLRWLDAAGAVQIDDYECANRVNETVGRCYTGRSDARFQQALNQGAAPGEWTLQACTPGGDCGVVDTFTVESSA